jgi:hypothetical protein
MIQIASTSFQATVTSERMELISFKRWVLSQERVDIHCRWNARLRTAGGAGQCGGGTGRAHGLGERFTPAKMRHQRAAKGVARSRGVNW